MKKPAPRLKSPTENAIEPGSAIEPEEADATVTAEPAGTEAADSQEEVANKSKSKSQRQQAKETPKQGLIPRRKLH